jgi:DNA-binding response OmpR family regulator
MADLIAQLGFDVRVAHEGEQAMAIAASFGPETALLDIGLPAMDGYSLATRLRRLRDGAPLRLIAVSGYGQATDRAKSVLAGFDEHAVKPIGIDHLRELLRNAPRSTNSIAP